jgi:uncharacterized protein DUF3606
MADGKKKSGRSDREKINVNEDYELCQEIWCQQEELKKAVQKVGSSAEAVRKQLGK